MDCPECGQRIGDKMDPVSIGEDADGGWCETRIYCPTCRNLIYRMSKGEIANTEEGRMLREPARMMAPSPRAKFEPRPLPPKEVPEELAQDYIKACRLLSENPGASADLSLQCIRRVLAIMLGGSVAYPKDTKSLADTVSLYPGVPDHQLDVLEALFDLFYVKPALRRANKALGDPKIPIRLTRQYI
jgi:hypothetical protein